MVKKKEIKSEFCSFCDNTGVIHDSHFNEMGEAPLSPCPRCVEPKCVCSGEEPYYYFKGEEIEVCFCRQVRMKINRINNIYKRSGIDKKYRWKFFSDFEVKNEMASKAKKAAYDIVIKFPHINKGLYLWGPPGTGKTLLSSIVLTELIIRHATEGRFMSISRDYFGKLKSTFNVGSSRYGEAINIEQEYSDVDILVIDDFGVSRDTEWEQETLYNLVDSRYESEKFTIFTSNNNPLQSIKEISGGRILSRIKEMCRIINLGGEDFRDKL
ncbi:ATP-binding protein [Spirochaetota bacterium]